MSGMCPDRESTMNRELQTEMVEIDRDYVERKRKEREKLHADYLNAKEILAHWDDEHPAFAESPIGAWRQ